jgi:CRP-like cAMP-binding protein
MHYFHGKPEEPTIDDNPTLSCEHIDRIREVAQLRSVKQGEKLYEPSDPNVPLYVVLDGAVTVIRPGVGSASWLYGSLVSLPVRCQ